MPKAEREQRTVWVVDAESLSLVHTLAYLCEPSEHRLWWVPATGYSVLEARLHPHLAGAEDELRELIAARRAALDTAEARLGPEPWLKYGFSTYRHLREDGLTRRRSLRLAFGLWWWR